MLREREQLNDKQLSEAKCSGLTLIDYHILFPKSRGDNGLCCHLHRTDDKVNPYRLTTSYFIGADWIQENKAIQIFSKYDKTAKIDYLKMLLTAVSQSDTLDELKELCLVKWNAPQIKISIKQDVLTPFLIMEYLAVLKSIVKKGLRKSYYTVDQSLNSRVKGKILVGQTVKRHLSRGQQLNTICRYQEYGIDHEENRLLNQALIFGSRFLESYGYLTKDSDLKTLLGYIKPAFSKVSETADLRKLVRATSNPFFKDYTRATRLAKQILARFAYNIKNTEEEKVVLVPPHWIDMSKLWELYVLGILRKSFGNGLTYQKKVGSGNEIDYLLNYKDGKGKRHHMVIDGKYRTRYTDGGIHHSDMRQVAGYSRLNSLLKQLGRENDNEMVDCCIIYPAADSATLKEPLSFETLKHTEITDYRNIYKLGIHLPRITKTD